MISPLLESCGENCGYAAAFVACLAYGSFCVPMKGEAARSVDVDPLVFQSYKTFLCLISALALVYLTGMELSFTPWGIASGFFWVPAGVLHICAVRTAGLAISQGTSSSVVVLVSFTWGIFVFLESVHSVHIACMAILLICCGICGMSFFSSHGKLRAPLVHKSKKDGTGRGDKVVINTDKTVPHEREQLMKPVKNEITKKHTQASTVSKKTDDVPKKKLRRASSSDCFAASGDEENLHVMEIEPSNRNTAASGTQMIIVSLSRFVERNYNVHVTPAQIGLACAATGGVWGGCVMVPLHFAGESTKGLGYTFSFAVGSSLVNVLCWVARYFYHYMRSGKNIHAAYQALPSFHWRKMMLSGCLSGLLWSLGNMGSILSVTYLGVGVGVGITQSAMLVSGLWGIFYFKEIVDVGAIRGWIMSAMLTISGIVILSSQHVTQKEVQAFHKG
mmetsp:Transcript_41608/g.61039  ORF Transcript_41608/g.61039 Transcript_41608/m.61039 type:complete len:447 (-) Transcript_41608:314-1654(-)